MDKLTPLIEAATSSLNIPEMFLLPFSKYYFTLEYQNFLANVKQTNFVIETSDNILPSVIIKLD